jgi:tetratricopeptide (TPR) repeat protein
VAVTLYILGVAAFQERQHDRARALGEESLKQFRELRDGWAAGSAMRLVARAALGQGDYPTARRLYEESLQSARSRGEMLSVARALMGLALVAARMEQSDRAAVLIGADEALRAEIGVPVPDAERHTYSQVIEAIRAELGEAAYAASWGTGRAMTWEQAAEYALAAEVLAPGGEETRAHERTSRSPGGA